MISLVKILLLITAISLVNINLIGQVKPSFFPEDFITNEALKARCYCSPGVKNKSMSRGAAISYNWLNRGTFNEQDYSFTDDLSRYNKFQNFKIKLKAPIILKDNFKLLIGYSYFSEFFDFQNIGTDFNYVFNELNNQSLKSNSLSLIISKPLNETRYLAFRFKYSASGDYENLFSFESQYAIYKFAGFYGIKPHENLEWGIGLGVSKSFRRNNILPFILFNKNFNKKWGIEAVFPGLIFGRYNLNTSNIFLFGAEYNSESYRIDSDNELPLQQFAYAYNHSEIKTSIRYEHRFTPWVWGAIKTGYQFNFSSDFETKNEIVADFNANPTGALFLNLSIFISPPNKDQEHTY